MCGGKIYCAIAARSTKCVRMCVHACMHSLFTQKGGLVVGNKMDKTKGKKESSGRPPTVASLVGRDKTCIHAGTAKAKQRQSSNAKERKAVPISFCKMMMGLPSP